MCDNIDFEKLLQWISGRIGRKLKTVERYVVQGSWQSQTYQQIGNQVNYQPESLRNGGKKLFDLLSETFSRPINKTNLKFELEKIFYEDNIAMQKAPDISNIKESQTEEQREKELPYKPFGDQGCIRNPARFFDREELFHKLIDGLSRGCNQSIVGVNQIGKSSILWRLCNHLGSQQLNLNQDRFILIDMQSIYDEQEFFTALCTELQIDQCRGWELKRRLGGKRYILCLDEIERLRDDNFSGRELIQLRGLADGATAPLTLVIASRSPLSELFPDSPHKTSPLSGIFTTIRVEGFSPQIARNFIEHRLQDTDVTFTEDQINELITRSDGHPARLQEYADQLYSSLTQQ